MMIRLSAQHISKTFQHREVFSDISFSIEMGQSLALTGRNGSGKTTLAKIIAGVLSPTSGKILVTRDGNIVSREKLFSCTGFVAPYLQLYDEFTAYENIILSFSLRGLKPNTQAAIDLLKKVGLHERRDDLVRIYSSGMKQRLKFAAALVHQPQLLILDEPTSNLDEEGIEMVHSIMKEQIVRGILIVATNDKKDLRFIDQVISLQKDN